MKGNKKKGREDRFTPHRAGSHNALNGETAAD
jgi:hypothetical protein